MWRPLDPGAEYRARFEANVRAMSAFVRGNGVRYSSHWPLQWVEAGDAPRPRARVLLVGKAANGFARLNLNSATVSIDRARRSGSGFDPFPGGNYHGGFWKFIAGETGMFSTDEFRDRIRLGWTNIYKIGRGYNDVTSGWRPVTRGASRVVYGERLPAADGRRDNNPSPAERRVQGAARMTSLLREEVEAFAPVVIVAVCKPWLVDAIRGAGGNVASAPLTDVSSYEVLITEDFLGTGRPLIAGRHPIRVTGGFPTYAASLRREIDERGWLTALS